MKALVIGSGGREHALAWKLGQSPKVSKVYVAPGNAGTALDAENVPISEKDFPALIDFCKKNDVELVVVGPEAPLSAGAVDAFAKAGIRAFGPNQKAARIEGSKVFCKEVLNKAFVPTAAAKAFDSAQDAYRYVDEGDEGGFVVKADGLAAGKGVIVAASQRRRRREFQSRGERSD